MNKLKFWGVVLLFFVALWWFAPENPEDKPNPYGNVQVDAGIPQQPKLEQQVLGTDAAGNEMGFPVPENPNHAMELLLSSGSVKLPNHEGANDLNERIAKREKEDAIPALFRHETIRISTARGRLPLVVGMADTPYLLAKGLMQYRSFPAGIHGVLFLFEREDFQSMWMHNTYVPLDMLFIGADGEIVHIVENTTPLSTDSIISPVPAMAALEIPAGSARKWKIAPGDTVIHPFFARGR